MSKQNKGFDFLPMQTRKNSELSIILTSLIFHCELATINFCPLRSSTGKWWFCGGNSAETRWTKNPSRWEMESEDPDGLPRWAKKSTLPVRGGGDFEKPPELYCIKWLSRDKNAFYKVRDYWHGGRINKIDLYARLPLYLKSYAPGNRVKK